MTVESPDAERAKARDLVAKIQHDAAVMKSAVDKALAEGATEQEVIDALRDAYVRSLTDLAREDPETFALVVADLILARGLGA